MHYELITLFNMKTVSIRINQKIFLIVLLTISLSSCIPKNVFVDDAIENMRDSVLDKYSFSISQYEPDRLGLLAGNNEMGGMVLLSGLGLDSIWCSDLWLNDAVRIPMEGVKFILDDVSFDSAHISGYSQKQSLKDGIVESHVQFNNGTGYESKVLFSTGNRRLLVIKIKNISDKENAMKGRIRVPESGFRYLSGWPDFKIGYTKANRFKINKVNDHKIAGVATDNLFSPAAWYLRSDAQLGQTAKTNQFEFEVPGGEERVFYFSFVTKWGNDNYEQLANQIIENTGNYYTVEEQHKSKWKKDWETNPLLLIPDPEHEKLFYRSVFWLLCTSGSEQFLPGEAQFGNACWHMKPFTYGGAGWSTLALTSLGHFDKAEKMLKNHYKPMALKSNSTLYISDSLKRKEAFSFAHEVNIDGTTNNACDDQRHINGFALAMFHKYYLLNPDTAFLNNYLYPVAKGVAEFWSGIAIWNDSLNAYIFPKLRSLSEDLFEKSLLDIVLSAKWSLETAIHYADLTAKDKDMKVKWNGILQKLYIPEDESHYLEYLGDKEDRKYGSYQGVRSPVYLGYPTSELIKTLDTSKAINTLEHAWNRNNRGKGMIGFIASWYALSSACYGLGDLSLEMASHNFDCYDKTGTAICESPDNLDRYYFLTNTSSYLLTQLNMMVQSSENEIITFPAIPSSWKNVTFYNIPASNGIKVSGKMKDGLVQFIQFKKDNRIVFETKKHGKVIIENNKLRQK
jgi:hypothetical protein